VIEAGATVGGGTAIFPGGYVGAGASIGANCILYPRVVLYPGTSVGSRVILHAGVVIGSDGFGFVFDGERQIKVPQVGSAQIGDDVEIGANACIDRGALDETKIADGVKIDNLCHLGHNVRIGDHAIISAQTGIAGSSTVGREAIIGGQVGIADYCRVDDHGIVGAQCGIPSRKRVPAGQPFWGTPARPLKDIKRQQGYLRRLPGMAEEIGRLRQELATLKAKLG
jgi:UDP-3-O-[3-hydroxymyristoyl] glucosamine N-acyltransferase